MPRLLDLYCGAGGASVGYARAGWEVVGVTSTRNPTTPRVSSDARAKFPLDGFDAVHASPPCQHFAQLTVDRTKHKT